MSDEQPPKKAEQTGAPGWVMTFADLMSLLMCFFVLLLAFSEMDVQKFKQLAGSMKVAFGVQRDIRAEEIPKGTSVVAKEFSPSTPEPTVIKRVEQSTSDEERKKLALKEIKEQQRKQTESKARKIAIQLQEEIKQGLVEVETEGRKIIIRILEKGSFPSGSADMSKSFVPVIKKISDAIASVDGSVKVSGHTDDLPIATSRFRSNWELSAARAVSVVHELLASGEDVEAKRFEVAGFADTNPRVPNNNKKNRSKNRRVELVILQGNDPRELLKELESGLGDVAGVSVIAISPQQSAASVWDPLANISPKKAAPLLPKSCPGGPRPCR